MKLFEQEPGRKLRQIRELLGLKYRDVEEGTHTIARVRGSQEFIVGLSRLADIENRGTVPSIYRLYSLCAIYSLSVNTVLRWYGVHPENLAADAMTMSHRRTRPLEGEDIEPPAVDVPSLPHDADLASTTYISRQIQKWGKFPLALLNAQILKRRYAVIGTEDWGMFPLLWPGAFVQVDDRRRKPEPGPWSSEAERPIYLVERRDSFRCGWCVQRGRILTMQFHPTSGVEPEDFSTPEDGEIIGQVVGVAMRLDSAKRRRIRS